MRVCILTDYYYPQLGGITEHVHGQAVNLAARGHEVTILTGRVLHAPRVSDRDERVLTADGVELVHMGLACRSTAMAPRRCTRCSPRDAAVAALPRRAAIRRRARPRALQPELLQLAPFVLPDGAIGVGSYHSVFTPGRLRDLVHAPTRASLSRLHGHVVVSHACIEPLDHYFPGFAWRVVPNGIYEDHFTPSGRPFAELREDGDPPILFLGRFDPRNGLGIMLEAFQQCGARATAMCRYYAGRLAPEVAPSVHWAGRVDWNRPRYYASADVFCTPCQRASFGMVLLETMSCGRPGRGQPDLRLRDAAHERP